MFLPFCTFPMYWAVYLNVTSLEIELDAKAIMDILNKLDCVNNIISPILDNCRLLTSRIPQVRVKYCFRQVNRCVDSLPRMSFSLDCVFLLFIVRLWTCWMCLRMISMGCILTGCVLFLLFPFS